MQELCPDRKLGRRCDGCTRILGAAVEYCYSSVKHAVHCVGGGVWVAGRKSRVGPGSEGRERVAPRRSRESSLSSPPWSSPPPLAARCPLRHQPPRGVALLSCSLANASSASRAFSSSVWSSVRTTWTPPATSQQGRGTARRQTSGRGQQGRGRVRGTDGAFLE